MIKLYFVYNFIFIFKFNFHYPNNFYFLLLFIFLIYFKGTEILWEILGVDCVKHNWRNYGKGT